MKPRMSAKNKDIIQMHQWLAIPMAINVTICSFNCVNDNYNTLIFGYCWLLKIYKSSYVIEKYIMTQHKLGLVSS